MSVKLTWRSFLLPSYPLFHQHDIEKECFTNWNQALARDFVRWVKLRTDERNGADFPRHFIWGRRVKDGNGEKYVRTCVRTYVCVFARGSRRSHRVCQLSFNRRRGRWMIKTPCAGLLGGAVVGFSSVTVEFLPVSNTDSILVSSRLSSTRIVGFSVRRGEGQFCSALTRRRRTNFLPV